MNTTFIGTTFPQHWQYGRDELLVIDSLIQQVNTNFPTGKNLIINTTWFGPQFNNGAWESVQKLINTEQKYDRLFLSIIIDPLYITDDQINDIVRPLGITEIYITGHRENSPYYFNFECAVLEKHLPEYTVDQMAMLAPEHVFLCYQRKPRWHRVELAKRLIENNLIQRGIITLGENNADYDWSEGAYLAPMKLNEDIKNINPTYNNEFGIVNDLASLGQLSIWQNHFLNIVSETEFNNWHATFVSEKTFKPLLGLRPFVIHGQTAVYDFLTKNGFKTFNQYWEGIYPEMGNDQIGDIVEIVKLLCSKSPQELTNMYNDMLPDLLYNRERFFEFAKEQQHKIDNLFV